MIKEDRELDKVSSLFSFLITVSERFVPIIKDASFKGLQKHLSAPCAIIEAENKEVSRMSKNFLGKVLLGTAVAVAGVSLYLYVDESARGRVESFVNREKAKNFIKQNLKGSEKLVAAIDRLTDTELSTVMKLIDDTTSNAEDVAHKASKEASRAYDRAIDFGTEVVDKAVTLGNDVYDRVQNYLA